MQKMELLQELKKVRPEYKVLIPFNTPNVRAFKGVTSIEYRHFVIDFAAQEFIESAQGVEAGYLLWSRDFEAGESREDIHSKVLTASQLVNQISMTPPESEWVLYKQDEYSGKCNFISEVRIFTMWRDPLFETLWFPQKIEGSDKQETFVILQ